MGTRGQIICIVNNVQGANGLLVASMMLQTTMHVCLKDHGKNTEVRDYKFKKQSTETVQETFFNEYIKNKPHYITLMSFIK